MDRDMEATYAEFDDWQSRVRRWHTTTKYVDHDEYVDDDGNVHIIPQEMSL